MKLEELVMFPEALREARKKAKLSQAELARKAGISLISIKRYESGDSFPDITTLGSISVALPGEPLIAAWSNSWLANNTTEEGVSPRWNERMKVYLHARDNAEIKYWNKIIEEGNRRFIRQLITTAQWYQTMNMEGIKKAIEAIELISKVPEYKTETPWAFKDDDEGKAKNNAKGESNANDGNDI